MTAVESRRNLQHPPEVPTKTVPAIVMGILVLLAVSDWLINDSLRLLVAVGVGAVIGLVLLLVRSTRRGSDRP